MRECDAKDEALTPRGVGATHKDCVAQEVNVCLLGR
jgi:hypothetical protein